MSRYLPGAGRVFQEVKGGGWLPAAPLQNGWLPVARPLQRHGGHNARRNGRLFLVAGVIPMVRKRHPINGTRAGAAAPLGSAYPRSVPARTARGRHGDSCGCAMGARFTAAVLILSVLWYSWHWHSLDLSLWSIFLRIMLFSFFAAAAGKIAGMTLFKVRSLKFRTRSD